MKTNAIHIGGGKRVLPQNIILLEADINYTRLYLKSGEQLIVATTLKELEQRFVVLQNFFRSHKSHIVNLDYLTDYKEDTHQIVMESEKIVLLSRRRTKKFQLLFNKNANPSNA